MNTKQYAIVFTSDWTWDIVHEIGKYMDILIDDSVLDNALDEEDSNSINNIVKFYDDTNKNNLIVACCFDDDIFHYLIVRCNTSIAEAVKKKLLEMDTNIRKQAKQEIQTDLKDLSGNDEYGLNSLQHKYNIFF